MGISIIGNGNMGSAIGGLAAAAGEDVQFLGRAGEPITGDIVIVTAPFHEQDAVVATHGAELAGKVVVEISNPLDFTTFDALTVPADSSAAAVLAAKLPESKVVKAFNTNFAATLATKSVGGDTTTVLIAGDDADAKAAVAAFVTAAGLAAVDAGSLKRARELESIGFLQLTLAVGESIGWTGGFALKA